MKVVGSYASVTKGVSEQVPQDRLPGQMWEQVNMVSDPVRGVARRAGSTWVADTVAFAATSLTAGSIADMSNYREYTFFVNDKEYTLLFQNTTKAAGDQMPTFACLNKDEGKFLRVVNSNPTTTAPWFSGGLSAVTTVGDYLVMAAVGHGGAYTTVPGWVNTKRYSVAWVRGGAYSRTFTLKVTCVDNTVWTSTYTTLASSYPNLLNTSDIALDSNYQKNVNDRVNAYNSAVNAWIGQAATSVQPQFIAQQLANNLNAQGFAAHATTGLVGGTITLDGVVNVSCDDSGDGTLFRGVSATLDDPGKLSSVHNHGKIVQIQAKGSKEPYYMRFLQDAGAGWGTGTWVEGAGETVTVGTPLLLAAVSADGNDLVLGTATDLNAAKNPTTNVSYGFTAPGYVASVAGDTKGTGAIPYFFGKEIAHLTMFQDRLVIIADGTVFMSRTGDYFNFFRRTMLAVNDDDPIEVYALGAQDDKITKSVTYNKDLFMFGGRNQYVISGRVNAAPATISISTTASVRDANQATPVTNGNLIFYTTQSPSLGTGQNAFRGQLNQFQLGLFQDTPETYQVSKQLDHYIMGNPVEIAAISTPPTVFLRTDSDTSKFYVYSYIDEPGSQSRAWDSWGRWECSDSQGDLLAITPHKQTLLTFWLQPDGAPGHVANYRLVCNRFTMDSSQQPIPYLDGARLLNATGGVITAQWANRNTASMWADCYVAVGDARPEFMLHTTAGKFDTFYAPYATKGYTYADFWAGWDFSSYVELTPPYMRDKNDKAIVNGRLVITRYTVSLTDTGGMDASLKFNNTTRTMFQFNGRITGRPANLIGVQPVATTAANVPCGRSNTEHTITLTSRTCVPMTISAIEWVGQYFSNQQRV